jgi:hypothetical protein
MTLMSFEFGQLTSTITDNKLDNETFFLPKSAYLLQSVVIKEHRTTC